MDKIEELITFANKQEALLIEMMRRMLNHELTIEYQKAVIQNQAKQLQETQILQAKIADMENVAMMQRNHIQELEAHLRQVPAKRTRKVKDVQPNSA